MIMMLSGSEDERRRALEATDVLQLAGPEGLLAMARPASKEAAWATMGKSGTPAWPFCAACPCARNAGGSAATGSVVPHYLGDLLAAPGKGAGLHTVPLDLRCSWIEELAAFQRKAKDLRSILRR